MSLNDFQGRCHICTVDFCCIWLFARVDAVVVVATAAVTVAIVAHRFAHFSLTLLLFVQLMNCFECHRHISEMSIQKKKTQIKLNDLYLEV